MFLVPFIQWSQSPESLFWRLSGHFRCGHRAYSDVTSLESAMRTGTASKEKRKKTKPKDLNKQTYVIHQVFRQQWAHFHRETEAVGTRKREPRGASVVWHLLLALLLLLIYLCMHFFIYLSLACRGCNWGVQLTSGPCRRDAQSRTPAVILTAAQPESRAAWCSQDPPLSSWWWWWWLWWSW